MTPTEIASACAVLCACTLLAAACGYAKGYADAATIAAAQAAQTRCVYVHRLPFKGSLP
jgi:hypothetical protein